MSGRARLGLLGGTLDPVHNGHLETARAARAALGLDCVWLVPSGLPPHRQTRPSASGYHRFAMAALAVNGVDGLEASDVELTRVGPSYTAGTLDRLRDMGFQPAQIFFITGADAFAEIATWHRYPEVLDLAHFVVISRPGHPSPRLPTTLPGLARRMRPGTPQAAAASNPTIFLVDASTPDVSSSEIRSRLQRGEGVRGMIPPAVETHIRQHGLYLPSPSPAAAHSPADHLHGED
jgi:nicotinate-nucleotide adenylyltransferase